MLTTIYINRYPDLNFCFVLFLSEIPNVIVNVAEQIEKEVNDCLKQHGYQLMQGDQSHILKEQIKDVVRKDHPVHKLICEYCIVDILL